jgi:uncharacterized membrane protein
LQLHAKKHDIILGLASLPFNLFDSLQLGVIGDEISLVLLSLKLIFELIIFGEETSYDVLVRQRLVCMCTHLIRHWSVCVYVCER